MARALPPKTVQCYHCDHRFEVGGRAQSTSCPGCNKPLMVADQEIKGQRGPIRELKTCGQIIVGKRGRLICQHIVAHNGLICDGIIDAKTVASRMPVTLGKKSNFKGDLTAPSVDIQTGAVIQPSQFAIGPPIDEADAPDSADPPTESPPESSPESPSGSPPASSPKSPPKKSSKAPTKVSAKKPAKSPPKKSPKGKT